MTRAAVIGCGDVSSVHLAAITANPAIELVGVCDAEPSVLAAAAAAYGVPGFADHRELLDEMQPDVVHICTPHHQHAAIAVACVERGINVVLEKPLAHTVAEGQRLVLAAAARPDVKIGVCFQNRYNAPVAAMRRLLNSGELGAVAGASATVIWERSAEYYRAKPWRGRWATSGGGLLMNQAIHTVDLLQWLLGDVTDVRGHAGNNSLADDIEVEDTAEMMLTHSGGARTVLYATVANSVNAPVTIEVTTEAATLRLSGDLVVTYADGRTTTVAERLVSSAGKDYWGASHSLLIDDFYARLGDAAPFWISPVEAAKSLRIIQDLYAYSEAAVGLGYPGALAGASVGLVGVSRAGRIPQTTT
ncbi:Gfo/Idh/MocA family oxidoreductase [Pengzhenrongella sp.]|jgi:predicted dehydrogenase|uniref:Gfo/Idh/MocA family protein n=1 Tax=Pengzhenrongella sp. TaxID=2888820 RepID=UPI002F942DB6